MDICFPGDAMLYCVKNGCFWMARVLHYTIMPLNYTMCWTIKNLVESKQSTDKQTFLYTAATRAERMRMPTTIHRWKYWCNIIRLDKCNYKQQNGVEVAAPDHLCAIVNECNHQSKPQMQYNLKYRIHKHNSIKYWYAANSWSATFFKTFPSSSCFIGVTDYYACLKGTLRRRIAYIFFGPPGKYILWNIFL